MFVEGHDDGGELFGPQSGNGFNELALLDEAALDVAALLEALLELALLEAALEALEVPLGAEHSLVPPATLVPAPKVTSPQTKLPESTL